MLRFCAERSKRDRVTALLAGGHLKRWIRIRRYVDVGLRIGFRFKRGKNRIGVRRGQPGIEAKHDSILPSGHGCQLT